MDNTRQRTFPAPGQRAEWGSVILAEPAKLAAPPQFAPQSEADSLPDLSKLAFPPSTKTSQIAARFGETSTFPSSSDPENSTFAPFFSLTRNRLPAWLMAGLLLVLGLVAVFYNRAPSVPRQQVPEVILIDAIVNHSGDAALGAVVPQALQFALEQSLRIGVLIPRAAEAAQRSTDTSLADAQTRARATSATRLIQILISRRDGVYIFQVDLYDLQSRTPLLEAREVASDRGTTMAALDRLSTRIRVALGESADSIARTSVPLEREASARIDALEAFMAGASANEADRPLAALAAWQRAVALDSRFTEGWIQLANLYREAHAEIAAADAATHARDSSAGGSAHKRLRAQASYELNATGDYLRASSLQDEIAATYPFDAEAGAQRSLLLRLQGRFTDSLQAAHEALARNPADQLALHEGAYALVALDRIDAARALEADRRNRPDASMRILLDALATLSPTTPDAPNGNLKAQVIHAQVLDASGQFGAGLGAWRMAIDAARSNPALESASSSLLAEAALNRALTGDCNSALELANEAGTSEAGPATLFHYGMTLGLCGDIAAARNVHLALMSRFPQSFAVKKYYLANLDALDEIVSGDAGAALTTLEPASPYGTISLTPLLRARAHMAANQPATASDDLSRIDNHRGATALSNPLLFPLAKVESARAYAAAHEAPKAEQAYSDFLVLWKLADPDQPLLAEARKHTK